MFQRFHAAKEEREGGFTLIELLVVILIIAILAAIAIPVFLRQREKGWRSQLESGLKNAHTAQESWLIENDSYTTDVQDLIDEEGLKLAEGIDQDATVITALGGEAFCIQMQHTDLGDDAEDVLAVSSESSEPQAGTCAADGVFTPAP